MMKIKDRLKLSFFGRIANSLFYEEGDWYGQRCSGHGVYPDGRKCGGCADCSMIQVGTEVRVKSEYEEKNRRGMHYVVTRSDKGRSHISRVKGDRKPIWVVNTKLQKV